MSVTSISQSICKMQKALLLTNGPSILQGRQTSAPGIVARKPPQKPEGKQECRPGFQMVQNPWGVWFDDGTPGQHWPIKNKSMILIVG